MPLYEYECGEHGVFEQTRTMAEAFEPGACPECGASAARILSVPSLSSVERSTRVALDRNERSRHEPRVVQRTAGATAARAEGGAGGGAPMGRGSRAPLGGAGGAAGSLRAASGGLPWAIAHR